MQDTARLAGFIAAHAIWSVSDGALLIPMLGSEAADGKRSLQRLVTGEAHEAVALGRAELAANTRAALRAALAFDGYITLADGKTDAVFIEARHYDPTSNEAVAFDIAIPYRHASQDFAVYRPKVLQLPPGGHEQLLEAFWQGVDSHEQAAAVWNAHIDQSR